MPQKKYAGSRPQSDQTKPSQQPSRRKWHLRRPGFQTLAGGSTALLALAAMLVPVDFVTEEPGPTFNTIGEVDGRQLIEIDGRPSFETSGELDMTTVSTAGGPNTKISALQTLATWLAPHTVVVPTAVMYDPSVTNEQVSSQNAADMSNSQETAEAAALDQLGIDFSEELRVSAISDDAAGADLFEEGDTLRALGGTELKSYDQIAEILDNNKDKPIEVTVQRQGAEKTFEVTPRWNEEAGHYVLGLYINRNYDFPFDVKYGVEEVGGPSAGMMFALGIIDEVTEGDMTGGKHFAGTGTISSDGTVGPIGGIAQKMVGARDSGAEIFLAPADNCSEVVGNVPEGLSAVKVSTLDEAYKAVTEIGDGADPASFPTCS
ncbi:YlbL family protein [Rothia aerolata]|uniref:endopeptidase La n=1 Tax=Rothia aerolata TaxID=1812262 RepID=A0A917MRC7_9MICC|nr:S16 family serine protease [Rothia aerolata]GGH59707.1 hypothetical protein GCM10007359_07160 [Rothia aerolata]